ncbi:PREDICTED: LOW QUALITY PROTEIN: cytochrome P450 3A9-like [Tinamus guttatus]|uniref:LOW QUALITY PROTEIN: cytochrome P450 3A9-like n=1 Tax=Tinamus guttatus TaxID=94827 RepID=UPI00052EE29A|nr:PREDICTED: LOW QUALITY PROTEIN: cytochrome P450 3A9-like [Tinamus guttatus]
MPFLPELALVTWLLFILFFSLLLLYGIWPFWTFKKLSIPGPRPLPFLGMFLECRHGVTDFDQKCFCFEKYGKIWGIFDDRQPVLVILDPVLIETILVKECCALFANHWNFHLDGSLESAVSISEDEQWRRIHSVLSPAFSSEKLKEFGACSIDVVASTSFSVNIDSVNNPSDPFVTNIKKFLKISFLHPLVLVIVLFPFPIPGLERRNLTLLPPEVMNFFNTFAKMKKGLQKGSYKSRVDFLQLMVDSQSSDGNSDPANENNSYKTLSDEEILAQALISVFAAYETTSSTLTGLLPPPSFHILYNLATYPDVQQQLQDEIDANLCNKATPASNALVQMEDLDMVVSKTLRLFPSGGQMERVCKETMEINGVSIPKDVVVVIPAYVMHHDPAHWPQPEELRPERCPSWGNSHAFNLENKESIDPYTYLPFGAGPRNCVGMRFALLTLKVAVVVLVQDFSFQPCRDTRIPLPLDTQVFMQPKKPIILRLC